MQYDGYFTGAVQAARNNAGLARYARELISYQRRVAWSELAGAEPDSTRGALRERVELCSEREHSRFATRLHRRGAFPVVVYTSGAQARWMITSSCVSIWQAGAIS